MKSKIVILVIIPMLILGIGNKLNQSYKIKILHKIEIEKKAEEKIKEQEKIKKKKREQLKKKQEEEKKKQQEQQEKEEAKKFEIKGEKIKCQLTFYTSLASENGGYEGITASGKNLYDGCIANNSLPFGTKILINGKTYTVDDRGCFAFNSKYAYDVYIPRNKGESDSAYKRRVNSMGRQYVTAYILD